MNPTWPLPRRLRAAGAATAALVLLMLAASHGTGLSSVGLAAALDATPTPSCTGCAVAPVTGTPLAPTAMYSGFKSAARNELGAAGPSYPSIARGATPPASWDSVSAQRPLSHVVLRSMAWEESGWLQFVGGVTNFGPSCNTGMMQVAQCMKCSDHCGSDVPTNNNPHTRPRFSDTDSPRRGARLGRSLALPDAPFDKT